VEQQRATADIPPGDDPASVASHETAAPDWQKQRQTAPMDAEPPDGDP
jgi:hypothetical protein